MRERHTQLLIATHNSGKARELRELLASLPIRIRDAQAMRLQLSVSEDAPTYAGNARLKALAYAQASGFLALADDSGLELEALGGAPGPRSARLVDVSSGIDAQQTPNILDAAHRRALLELLRAHPSPWIARFVCALALANPEGEVDHAEGVCLGEIIPQERGAGGFGYDPIFLVAGSEKTMAELPQDEKNRISHRARAVAAMLPILRRRLGLT
ncbi:MAG TPA: non-canonical purine NTP pyrophosphatase [Anaerolineales bacterium]|nr:non-canonical purine NTP pyrophosphatase [Anaerolineales bacterium]